LVLLSIVNIFNIAARGLSVGLIAVWLSACTSLMFQPSRTAFVDPYALGLPVDELSLQSGAALLHGWRLRPAATPRGSLLFLHGNGQNISAHLGAVYWLAKRGYEVLLFDYRGYGRSSGEADIDGVVLDTGNMLAWAADDACRQEHKLTVMGHSFGASLAIYATARYPHKDKLNSLISISAFSDYREITRDALAQHWLTGLLKWPLSLTISNRYRPAAFIGDVAPLPVYILHSRSDPIVPVHHADELFAAARAPRYRLSLDGGHNDVFDVPANRRRLLRILDDLGHAPCGSAH